MLLLVEFFELKAFGFNHAVRVRVVLSFDRLLFPKGAHLLLEHFVFACTIVIVATATRITVQNSLASGAQRGTPIILAAATTAPDHLLLVLILDRRVRYVLNVHLEVGFKVVTSPPVRHQGLISLLLAILDFNASLQAVVRVG